MTENRAAGHPSADLSDSFRAADYFEQRLAHETDCADVGQRLRDGDPDLVVVDARAASDFATRHVPGAVSLPHREITAERLDQFGPDVEFVTYCWGPHCNGATKAAARIARLGRPVIEMLGGMWGWEQEGFRFEGLDVRVDVGLLAFGGMDLLDFGGPYDVLLTANRLALRRGRSEVFDVTTIGEPCRAFGGLWIEPQQTVDRVGRLDVLVVPGAIDVDAVAIDADLSVLAERSEVVASVCTGTLLLDRAGLLDDRPVTTHWEDLDALAHRRVVADRRWVDHGDLVTSGGISSGIAMALHLVERFADRELAEATARQIDYVWTEERG